MTFHPALLMLAGGIAIPFAPKKIRQLIMVVFPAMALFATWNLEKGLQASIPFINNMSLIYLKVDELSWIFLFVLALISLIINIYALNLSGKLETAAQFIYVAASMGVVMAGDWLTLIFFWELMALSSVFLVWSRKEDESRRAGFRYLLVHFFGGNILLAGIFIKVSQGEYLISSLTNNMDLAGILILTGVAINAAIFPLHAWLPDAYPRATISGSVFMNSMTTKVAVYTLIRVFPGLDILIWAGVIMALVGVIYAMIANDLRLILSYHIVSQVGYMVAAVGLGSELALNGAVVHAFANILFKSLMFMGAGAILYATGTSKLTELGGLFRKLPAVVTLYFIGSMAISGLPYLNGFTSKSVILSAASLGAYPQVELLLYLASIGTLISTCLKVTYYAFAGQPKTDYQVKKLPINMYAAMTGTAILCFVYGTFPSLLYQKLPFEMNYVPYTLDHVISTVQLMLAISFTFILFAAVMKPKDAFLLDTDWFYRRPLVLGVKGLSLATVSIQEKLGSLWLSAVRGTYPILQNPLKWLDVIGSTKGTPESYSEDHYRFPVGAAVTLLLIVFISSYVYIII